MIFGIPTLVLKKRNKNKESLKYQATKTSGFGSLSLYQFKEKEIIVMHHNELEKLIKIVEKEAVCGIDSENWHKYETWEIDHKGVLPIYIVDAVSSHGLDDHEFHIMFNAIQPSGKTLVFALPHNGEDPFGEGVLPSGKHYSLTVYRYAELTVDEIVHKDRLVLDPIAMKIIPDSEIEAIKANLESKGSAL